MRLPPRRVTSIGLDLDNTIIDYSHAYLVLGPEFGVPEAQSDRDGIRSILRNSVTDDLRWQEFQSQLYTRGLTYAQPAPGLLEFVAECRRSSVRTQIISHKTPRSPSQFGSLDLRVPAMDWIRKNLKSLDTFTDVEVTFCDSLDQKVDAICAARLDAFVDDLTSVLNHPQWPMRTLAIRYSTEVPGIESVQLEANFPTLTTWLQSVHRER